MGIYDFYFRWLKPKNFPGVIQKSFINVTSFSIDGNSLIHNAAQLVYAYGNVYKDKYKDNGEKKKAERQALNRTKTDQELENEVFTVIGIQLLRLIRAVGPTQYFFLAIDGPAPQAKISQQRSRRFKNTIHTEGTDVLTSDSGVRVETLPTSPKEPMRFDPNAISPGTDFMTRLDKYLENFLKNQINNLTNVVYYSSHIVPGEGEHKIMDYYRRGEIKGQGQHVIYGMDTDLIMLTMALPVENILLWREDMDAILDIDVLKSNIHRLMANSPSAINDFILILFFFGNDFLPIQPSLDDFASMLDRVIYIYNELYTQYNLTYVKNIEGSLEIDWDSMVYLLKNLSGNEAYLLKKISELTEFIIKRESFDYASTDDNGIPQENVFSYDKFRNYWYHHEMYPRGDAELAKKLIGQYTLKGAAEGIETLDELYTKTGERELLVTSEKIDTMVKSYLTTIGWVFEYYIRGSLSVNLKWYYNYYTAPLFSDIYSYLSRVTLVELASDIGNYLPPMDNSFLNVFQQLLSILPVKSIKLVPKELQFLMISQESPIIDYYPETFIVDYELKNREYKGIAILPFVDPKRIIDAINNNVRFHPVAIEYYLKISPKKYTRDTRMNQIICDTRELKSAIGRGRGRGRGRGGRGRDRRQGTEQRLQGQAIPFIPGTSQERVLLTPQYTLNQGPYDAQSEINFVVPKI